MTTESRIDRRMEQKAVKFADRLLNIWIVFILMVISFAFIYTHFNFGFSDFAPTENKGNMYEEVVII